MTETVGAAPRSAVAHLLAEEAARVLGRAPAELHLLLVSGWRMDLDSVTALVFEPRGAEPVLVAKAAVGARCDALEDERRNLDLLALVPSEAFRGTIPRLLAFRRRGGAAVLVESVVAGARFRGAGDPASLRRPLERVADWLLLFHEQAGSRVRVIDDAAVARLVLGPLAAYRQRFALGAAEERHLAAVSRDAGALLGLPLVYQHGDLCPANLLVEGGAVRVIDWETPLVPGLPGFDLFHLLACSAALEDDHDGFALFERAFFGNGPMALVARAVLERYRRGLGASAAAMRILFTLYWIDYANEKALALGRGEVTDLAPIRGSGLAPWSLARFVDGRCQNLSELAENERNLVLQ